MSTVIRINNNYNCKKPIILDNAGFGTRQNIKRVNFNGYQNIDKILPKQINYVRLGTLISQSVLDEKISKFYDEYITLCASTALSKIQVLALKGYNKLAGLINPKALIRRKSQDMAIAVSKIIPDSLKVERANDNFYDLPKEVTESVVYIMKTAGNFSDFARVSQAYGSHMSWLGYTKASDLPTINGYGIMDDLLVLNYNKTLKTH